MTEPQSAEAVRADDARACGPGGVLSTETMRQAMDGLYFGPCLPSAEEAAFREELAERAQDIAAKITRGEIAHGLPAGYRFEFTRAKAPNPIDAAFTAQMRGTAPEPPPDGFMIPPGFAEWLRASIAELFGIPDEMLTVGGPLPPPSWRTRLRRKAGAWRERTARRAYKLIAGYWPDDGEDDW